MNTLDGVAVEAVTPTSKRKRRTTTDRLTAAYALAPWRVNRRTGCWTCRAGYGESQGYRLLDLLGRRIRAHRLAYRLFNGPIPRGMIVRHRCDNPACINPAHLLLGTKQDNTQDMLARGRVSRWEDRRDRWGRKHRRKLSRWKIRRIRRRQESSYQLAEIYGVSAVEVRRIRNGARCSGL